MTRQEREERDAAFGRLMEEIRGDHGRSSEHHFHSQIIAARRRRGWTQAELARRTGTSQPAIARLERGQAQPRLKTLHKLANVLGVRLVVRLED